MVSTRHDDDDGGDGGDDDDTSDGDGGGDTSDGDGGGDGTHIALVSRSGFARPPP